MAVPLEVVWFANAKPRGGAIQQVAQPRVRAIQKP
jgi:hypothetical protein